MAENKQILSVIVTTGSRLADLTIKDRQLIFIQDLHRIALDFNDKRVFYNQIIELRTDQERLNLLAPINGIFYFVIDTAVLWTYKNEWIQITTPPRDVINFGDDLPDLGIGKTLYVSTKNRNISVWDDELSEYITVADATDTISEDDISSLFLITS